MLQRPQIQIDIKAQIIEARSSVVDPKLFFSDPNPTFQEISDPYPDSDLDPISDPT